MKNQQVIETAKIAFREATDGTIKQIIEMDSAIAPFDLLMEVQLNQHAVKMLAKVKNEVRSQDLPQIFALFHTKMNANQLEKILIAQYIPSPVKNELKKNHINYLEATGNCLIQLDHLFLFVNDRKIAPVRKTREGKLWNKTGLRFVFSILTNDNFLKMTLREQAATSGIALGNLTGLREEIHDFLNPGEHTIKNGAFDVLLERWGLNYSYSLKPTLITGKFRCLNPKTLDKWKNLTMPKNTWWGGENAGAIITNYLKPKQFTIYTRNTKQLVIDWKLVPDENGNIELYEPFWPAATDYMNQNEVNPVIAWAELNFELDQRLRETADRIKEKLTNQY